MLDRDTVDSLARGVVEIIDELNAFYANPETEAAYLRWLDEKYGDSRNNSRIQNSPPDKKGGHYKKTH